MVTDSRRLLEEALARLRVFEEERAILRTLYRYGHTIDYGLEREWLDCFTDDAVFAFQSVSRLAPAGAAPIPDTDLVAGPRHQGRAQLAAFVAGHTRAPGRYHKHMLVEPVIEIAGDEARVQSYFARIDADESDSHAFIRAFGRYVDRMVKCPDGVWRIAERICHIEGRSSG